jgi:hypothetical protein
VTALDGVRLGIRLWRIDRVLVQSSKSNHLKSGLLSAVFTGSNNNTSWTYPKQHMTWAEEPAERRGSQSVSVGSKCEILAKSR